MHETGAQITQYLEAYAQSGDANAQFVLGLRAFHQGDCEEAEQWFRQAERLQNPRALTFLGRLALDRGDLTTAATYIERGLAAGDPHASLQMALLEEARGYPTTRVLALITEAASSGNVDAMLQLGCRLASSDPAASEKWMIRAANLGSVVAMHNLAETYRSQGKVHRSDVYARRATLYAPHEGSRIPNIFVERFIETNPHTADDAG